ncbi:uncharacterized protein LOC143777159 [Ranitomeya variabilis]|uniref:uncharacterized protein LOC143777159 n=1 Tax=Ranitomeya variabilis TaxID=490064 RepID=UPI004055EB58
MHPHHPSDALRPTPKVCFDINNLRLDPHRHNNFGMDERKALQNLKHNKDFVVREADKGGNVVLWPHEMYTGEILRQLQRSDCYVLLPSDPTEFFKDKIDHLINRALQENIVTKKEADFLTTPTPIIPTFYALPKVHKSLTVPPDTAIDFLDLKLSIEDSCITCSLFRKTTATNSLLHFNSFHPGHLKNGIPRGQFLRLRRNCSSNVDFEAQARELSMRFKNRSYPRRIISQAYQHARSTERQSLLTKKVREPLSSLPLITTFNNQWSDVRDILSNNWAILANDKKILPFISKSPNMVARRAKNLRDNLCHSHYQRPPTKLNRGTKTFGSYPCGRCNICQFMTAQDGYSISVLSFQIRPKEFFTCRSRNIVDAIFCGCPKIYVGQTTQELRRRMQQHLSSISTASKDREKNKILTSVASHFLDIHGGKVAGFGIGPY